MRFILFTLGLLFLSNCFAGNQTLLQVFRTNYYPEKTVNYTVEVEPSCGFSRAPKFDIHFISTQSGKRLKGFSNYNKQYFRPKKVKVSGNKMSFQFKALDELSKKVGRKLSVSVKGVLKNGRCILTSDILANSSKYISKVKRVEVEFFLGALGHPKDYKWVGLVSPSQEVCLFGPCP